jgi:hypothetical protein
MNKLVKNIVVFLWKVGVLYLLCTDQLLLAYISIASFAAGYFGPTKILRRHDTSAKQ